MGLVLVFGVGGTPPALGARDSSLLEQLEKARSEARRGDLKRAAKTLDKAILVPFECAGSAKLANARLLAFRGQIAAELAKNEKELLVAETYLAWAIHEDPDELAHWTDYVRMRKRRQSYRLLVSDLDRRLPTVYSPAVFGKKSRSRQPSFRVPWRDWQFRFLSGLLDADQGKDEEAMRMLGQRRDTAADPIGYCPGAEAMGLLHLRRNSLARAWDWLSSIPAACSNYRSPSLYYHRGLVASRQNHPDVAIANFRESIQLDPSFIEARQALAGELLASSSDRLKARAHLKQILAERPELWSAWGSLWNTYADGGPSERGQFREFALSMAKTFPKTAETALAATLAAFDLSDYKTAQTHLRRVLELQPANQETRVAQLVLALAQRKAGEADRLLAELRDSSHRANQLWTDILILERFQAVDADQVIRNMSGDAEGLDASRSLGNFLYELARTIPESSFAAAAARRFPDSLEGRVEGPRASTQVLSNQVVILGRAEVELRRRVGDIERVQERLLPQVESLCQRMGIAQRQIEENTARILLGEDQRRLLQAKLNDLTSKLQEQRDEFLSRLEQTVAQTRFWFQLRDAQIAQNTQDIQQNRQILAQQAQINDRFAKSLNTLAILAQENRAELERHGVIIDRVVDWQRSHPAEVHAEVFRISKFISVGPSFGFLSFNLLAVLEELVHYAVA